MGAVPEGRPLQAAARLLNPKRPILFMLSIFLILHVYIYIYIHVFMYIYIYTYIHICRIMFRFCKVFVTLCRPLLNYQDMNNML